MNATEAYEAGQLAEAVTAALADVKKHPTDVGRRGFLCELLCFAGDLERADKQLDAIGHQSPDAMVGVALFRQLVRAEQARREFFTAGRVPEFAGLPTAAQKLQLEASILLREGNAAEANTLLAQAEELRPACKGTCDGNAFDDIRDLDDLISASFEVLTTTGKYYWIAAERVDSIEFRPPESPRDLLWRAAHMVVRDGPDGEVYLPVLYVDSSSHKDEGIQLGRATDWNGGEDEPVRGVGQRMFLVGEEDQSILSLGQIDFEMS